MNNNQIHPEGIQPPMTAVERLRAEVAEFRSIRDFLVKSLCKATGRAKEDVDLAPFGVACQHAAMVARLRSENLCAVCAGSPPISGRPCICGGSGRACDEAQHARELVNHLERQLAEAKQSQHDENCDTRDAVIQGKPCNCYLFYRAQLAEAQAQAEDYSSIIVEGNTEINEWRAKLAEANRLYHELLYAVDSAFPNESRHETALRYIRDREWGSNDAAQAEAEVKL